MAASFVGWYFATWTPERSPATMIRTEVTMPEGGADPEGLLEHLPVALPQQHVMAEMPMMKNAASV